MAEKRTEIYDQKNESETLTMTETTRESACGPAVKSDEVYTDKPLISIIIPIYNSEAYLDRCIQSILQQDYAHFELLLIDDGSTDQTGRIISGWKKKTNGSVCFTKKTGASPAQGIWD